MLQKRFLCLALCLCCCLGLVGGALALELNCDEQYCFQSTDFSEDQSLTGICITELPDPATGTVMLGSRVLRPGDILTAEQINQMTFVPLQTEVDADACVCYLPIYPERVEASTAMSISIRGREDKAPVAEDSALETYKNLANTGKLKVFDPEDQPLTFTVIRQPRRGSVTVQEDGSFTYTPKKNKVGTDSFTYTATDPAGKVSREATVTVEIMKPTIPEQYTDTAGTTCQFTSEWMKNTGLFVSEQVGGTACFQPEKTVSRGEFLTMLVKTLDMQIDKSAEFTGFTDETPNWLKPYLAAALRSGMTENWPDSECFGASEPITGAEAALLVQNALDLTASVATGKETDGELPAWAETAVTAMGEQGIQLDPLAELTREDAATVLYQVSQLSRSVPNSEVY
jgi:VCBS repeat-containing protein